MSGHFPKRCGTGGVGRVSGTLAKGRRYPLLARPCARMWPEKAGMGAKLPRDRPNGGFLGFFVDNVRVDAYKARFEEPGACRSGDGLPRSAERGGGVRQ